MKRSTFSIRLDPELDRRLDRAARRAGRSRSHIAREALRRHLTLAEFQDLRRRTIPLAQSAGYLTDEDVFGNN